jgi:tetratricopeptide (TPR) repeat protein
MAKYTKHQDEKIIELYHKGVDYFNENKNRAYTVLTIIVVIIAAVFVYFRYQRSKNEEADNQLLKVQQLYFSGSYEQAINGDSLGTTKGLIYIVDTYGGTESGQTAKLMLANCYYYLNDFDNALKYFKDFSGGNNFLKASSIAGIGAVNESKNEFLEAAKNYEKAANVGKEVPNNDEYLANAIRNYFYAKDIENMKKIIAQLKKDYPKSKFISQVLRYDPVQ